jgi:hypothetical protein
VEQGLKLLTKLFGQSYETYYALEQRYTHLCKFPFKVKKKPTNQLGKKSFKHNKECFFHPKPQTLKCAAFKNFDFLFSSLKISQRGQKCKHIKMVANSNNSEIWLSIKRNVAKNVLKL